MKANNIIIVPELIKTLSYIGGHAKVFYLTEKGYEVIARLFLF